MSAQNNNLSFKVSVLVNGQKQLVNLEMSMEDLAEVSKTVIAETRKLKGVLNESMVNMAATATTINAVASAFESLSRGYDTFDKSMRAANTMAQKSADGLQILKNQIKELSTTVPVARDLLADGLYQVISNGVPEDNWVSFLEKSAKASVGGIADLGKTITVTSTIIKNYGLAWESAGDIQDKIQLTAKNGVTSFEQLADALPKVTGNAATLGVSIDELMSTFATLTGVSGNTAEVSTQLSAIFTALVKPSSEAAETAKAMGIEFNAASIKAAGGMKQFLANIDTAVKTYSNSSGVLVQEVYGKLFGSAEALRAIGPLTGQLAETFERNVNSMSESAGVMDFAFNEMSGSSDALARHMDNLMLKFTDVFGGIASKINPVLQFTATTGQAALGLKALIPIFTYLRIASKSAGKALKGMGISLKGLLISSGVGIAIVALTSIIECFANSADDATESIYGLNDRVSGLKNAQQECDRVVAQTTATLDMEAARLRVLTNANIDTTKAVAELNSKYGAAFGTYKTASEWMDVLTTKTKAYALMLGYQQKMQSLASAAAEANINKSRVGDEKIQWEKDNRKKMRFGRKDKVTGLSEIYSNDKEWIAMRDSYTAYTDELEEIEKEQERVVELMEKLRRESGLKLPQQTPVPTVVPGTNPENSKAPRKQIIDPGTEAYYKNLAQDLEGKLSNINIELEPVKYQNLVAQLMDVKMTLAGIEGHRHRIEVELAHPDMEPLTSVDAMPGKLNILSGFKPLKASDIVPEEEIAKLKESTGEPFECIKKELRTDDAVSMGLGATADMLGSLSQLTNESAAAWLQWGANIIDACSKAIPAIMAVTAAKAAESAVETPIVGWLMAGAAIASVIAAFAGIPKFADGGIAYGPTLGLFGEYAGASNNPEVVAPLDKLRGMLNNDSGTAGGTVKFKIDGRTLVGILEKENNVKRRS